MTDDPHQPKQRDRQVLTLTDFTEADIAALKATRAPEASKDFDELTQFLNQRSEVRTKSADVPPDEMEALIADAVTAVHKPGGAGPAYIDMPGRLDGIALAEVARASHPLLPVVFITGGADAACRARTLCDPTAVFEKPFRLAHLLTTVQRLAGRSGAPVPGPKTLPSDATCHDGPVAAPLVGRRPIRVN